MFGKFLHSEVCSQNIAYIAVIFQTVITLCIWYVLIASFDNPLLISGSLVWFVLADCIFVCLHLTYRALYRGKKIILDSSLKKVLITHSVSSLSALLLTLHICFSDTYSVTAVYISLGVWAISLLSGIWFFSKKYKLP
jgi:hypothetical protein